MFKMSDDFSKGLDFTPMTEKLRQKSVLRKAESGDQMVFHAFAWDFMEWDTAYDGENVLGVFENNYLVKYLSELERLS